RPTAKLAWTRVDMDYQKEALEAANRSDVIIFCGGISPNLEGEEMPIEVEGFSHGDRTNIKLPAIQEELLKKLKATGKPIVYINFSGSAIALNWEDEKLSAIVQAFYPGEATGTAMAALLFGEYSPSGKLPVTFYKSVKDLPDFSDYNMTNRTYKFFAITAKFG
ncbi:MAG: glycoside hydrolase family 3 C-terminal domain-containing protein, partial [Candidatus Scalindua sp.]